MRSKAPTERDYSFPGLGIGTCSSGIKRIRNTIFLAAFFFLDAFLLGNVGGTPARFQSRSQSTLPCP